MNLVAGRRQIDEEHAMAQGAGTTAMNAITHDRIDSITLSVREEELLEWLKTTALRGLAAFPTVSYWRSEIETGKNNGTLAQPPTELRDMGLRWLALSFDVMSMISSGLRG